tara:strand:+ start:1606 stop:2067 length:462 start_codon:yes stop_codon:yes gene_type:complete
MVANSDLKCFVRTAKNGVPYRACLPKNKKPYKKKQDLRGEPHSAESRKQPRQLAYPNKMTKAEREKKERKGGIDNERAKIVRRWQKKIDKETTKEGKAKMSVGRNKKLAEYERKKKEDKKNQASRKVPIKIKKKKEDKKKKERIVFTIKKKKK